MYHLDTNIVVAYLRGNRHIAEQISTNIPDVAVDTIVLAELLYGVRISACKDENLLHLQRFLQMMQVVPFDQASSVFPRDTTT